MLKTSAGSPAEVIFFTPASSADTWLRELRFSIKFGTPQLQCSVVAFLRHHWDQPAT